MPHNPTVTSCAQHTVVPVEGTAEDPRRTTSGITALQRDRRQDRRRVCAATVFAGAAFPPLGAATVRAGFQEGLSLQAPGLFVGGLIRTGLRYAGASPQLEESTAPWIAVALTLGAAWVAQNARGGSAKRLCALSLTWAASAAVVATTLLADAYTTP